MTKGRTLKNKRKNRSIWGVMLQENVQGKLSICVVANEKPPRRISERKTLCRKVLQKREMSDLNIYWNISGCLY